MLSIIVGQLKLDEGTLTVFGGLPGDGKIGIPGKNVGYMPQVKKYILPSFQPHLLFIALM